MDGPGKADILEYLKDPNRWGGNGIGWAPTLDRPFLGSFWVDPCNTGERGGLAKSDFADFWPSGL